jgi:3-phosphoshikimate 1-carboxyvinyltransferase
VPVPADPAIAQRALLIAALCEGETRLSGFSGTGGREAAAMVGALRALGVAVDEPAPGELVVRGAGLHGLRAPAGAIPCGTTAVTARLLCGALAAQRFGATLVCEGAAGRSPMAHIARALRARGAVVEGRRHPTRAGELLAPLTVGPLAEGRVLAPLEYEAPLASADLKGAVLLSGLYAEGATRLREPMVSPDHTERLLATLGCPLRAVGSIVEIDPAAGWSRRMPGFAMRIPGDLSAAALLIAAAQLVEGSRVTARGVGVNPTRSGLLEIARDMGAGLSVEPHGEHAGEPLAELHAWPAPLSAGLVGGETLLRAAGEIPVAFVLAARARGTTSIRDVALLPAEPGEAGGAGEGTEAGEAAAAARIVNVLRAFGVVCEETPDGFAVHGTGGGALAAADVDSGGDPGAAMAAAVLALAASGPSRVRDAGCVADVYPKFVATLRALGARVDVEP